MDFVFHSGVVTHSDKRLLFTTKSMTGRLPIQLYTALLKASSLEVAFDSFISRLNPLPAEEMQKHLR